MTTKFARDIKASIETETGEKVSWVVVDREVEGLCFQFWSMADAEGLDTAVRLFPDVARYLARPRRFASDSERATGAEIRRLLNPPCVVHTAAPRRSLEAQFEQAAEAVEAYATHLSETRAEAANERALFGDSWPGSAQQIADLAEGLAKADADWWRLADWLGRGPERGPHQIIVFDGEEPF